MPTPGSSAKLESYWPTPRIEAVAVLPKLEPACVRVTLGTRVAASMMLDSLRASIIWAVKAVIASGVVC